MSVDTKEELSRVCESIIGYQKGLEDIERYIGRLNQYVKEMDADLKESDPAGAFASYGDLLEELQEKVERVKELTEEMRDAKDGFLVESRIIRQFNYHVEHFETDMEEFNKRADNLSKKLYNKDFNNAIKAMHAIAEDAKQSGTYEYRHVTEHDYDILKHEYESSLKSCRQKRIVTQYLAAVTDVLVETRLKRGEFESLQRLTEKMVHSDSKALRAFLQEVQQEH